MSQTETLRLQLDLHGNVWEWGGDRYQNRLNAEQTHGTCNWLLLGLLWWWLVRQFEVMRDLYRYGSVVRCSFSNVGVVVCRCQLPLADLFSIPWLRIFCVKEDLLGDCVLPHG